MEPPKSWDRLTASLAVCDLSKPYRAWAFLALQGLVRDLPGDRESFIVFVKQERGKEITGPSAASRIAGLLQRSGAALPQAGEPDPDAELATQRFAVIRDWAGAEEAPPMSGEFVHCVHCGERYEVGGNFAVCPRCRTALADRSATVGKPCPSCRNLNLLYAQFCESCGQSINAQVPKPEDARARGADAEEKPGSEIWWNEVRAFRLFGISTNPKDVAERTADLWHVMRSVIQDLAVVKELMREKGAWDEAHYKELREKQMVADHSGAGDSPWTHYSYYPYTLNEIDFLKRQLAAGDDDVKDFERRVESAEKLS